MKLKRIRKIAFSLGVLLLLSALPISRPLSASALDLEPTPIRIVDDLVVLEPLPGNDNLIMPMATYINHISTSLSINSTGLSTMAAMAYVYNKNSFFMQVTLQKKVLFWWTDVVTFQHYGTEIISTTNRYSIKQSGTYRSRAKVTCNAETLTVYSGEVKTP